MAQRKKMTLGSLNTLLKSIQKNRHNPDILSQQLIYNENSLNILEKHLFDLKERRI